MKLINLISIDEAHLISQFSEEFRPDFRKMILQFPVTIKQLFLSGTITKLVEKDLNDVLPSVGINNCNTIYGPVDRANVTYIKLPCKNSKNYIHKITYYKNYKLHKKLYHAKIQYIKLPPAS
jgi:superfamily II DNA helicase RecQ